MRADLALTVKGLLFVDGIKMLLQSGLRFLQSIPEAAFWTAGLVGVATMDPEAGVGFTLCLLEHLGVFCPGDGLGQATAYLVRGNFAASWSAHPLAVPVLLVLLYHIATLCWTRRQGDVRVPER